MKKFLVITALFAGGMVGSALAAGDVDAEQVREQMRMQCAEVVNSVPAEHQAAAEKSCQCVVDNTDYEAVKAAMDAGDTARLEELQNQVVASCSP